MKEMCDATSLGVKAASQCSNETKNNTVTLTG